MRRRVIASILVPLCFSLLSCHARGIIELSRSDIVRCDAMVARDGELLTALSTALDGFLAAAPDSGQNLQDTRERCREHSEEWNRFVREMYEKYGLSEENYRLDVFRGSFSPRVLGERTAVRESNSRLISLSTKAMGDA